MGGISLTEQWQVAETDSNNLVSNRRDSRRQEYGFAVECKTARFGQVGFGSDLLAPVHEIAFRG
jgi:hypothetical protein